MTQKQRQLILGLVVLILILFIALLRLKYQNKSPRDSWVPSSPPIVQTIFYTSGEEITFEEPYEAHQTAEQLAALENQLTDVTENIQSNESKESYLEWRLAVEDTIRYCQRHGDMRHIQQGKELLAKGFLKFYASP